MATVYTMPDEAEVKAALRAYGLSPDAAQMVSTKPKKPVWQISAPKGAAFLKRLPFRPARAAFAVEAGAYLHAQGAGVPRILRTKDGELSARVGQASYVLLSAVAGHPPSYAKDLGPIAAALARFHERSQGYVAPPGSIVRDHLDTWRVGYRQGLARLRAAAALARGGHPLGSLLEEYAAEAGQQAREAMARLDDALPIPAALARERPWLCHQDYAASNLRIDEHHKVVAFDTDSVAYDLPVRDLRKLLNKVMKVAGTWRAEPALLAVRAYAEVRQPSKEECAVLLADLQFPHLLAGLAKKLFLKPTPEWPQQECARRLAALLALERSKPAVLGVLATEWGLPS